VPTGHPLRIMSVGDRDTIMNDHSTTGGRRCLGPYGGAQEAADRCQDPARFEIARHGQPALSVCPVHLGPSLLLAACVLWPPRITMVG
jgi:hypothetical protein